jgi:hypothetical protein
MRIRIKFTTPPRNIGIPLITMGSFIFLQELNKELKELLILPMFLFQY